MQRRVPPRRTWRARRRSIVATKSAQAAIGAFRRRRGAVGPAPARKARYRFPGRIFAGIAGCAGLRRNWHTRVGASLAWQACPTQRLRCVFPFGAIIALIVFHELPGSARLALGSQRIAQLTGGTSRTGPLAMVVGCVKVVFVVKGCCGTKSAVFVTFVGVLAFPAYRTAVG